MRDQNHIFGTASRGKIALSIVLYCCAVLVVASKTDSSQYYSRILVFTLVTAFFFALFHLPSFLEARRAGRLRCRLSRNLVTPRFAVGWLILLLLTFAIDRQLIDTSSAIILLIVAFFAGAIGFLRIRLYDKGIYCPAVGYIPWSESAVEFRHSDEAMLVIFSKTGRPRFLTATIRAILCKDEVEDFKSIVYSLNPAHLDSEGRRK